MTVIYQTTFVKIGEFAPDAIAENMLITFKQGAPADLENYCFIHNHGELTADVQVGDVLEISGIEYPVTAVGDVANVNLRELGHVTWRFDGATEAEYPGTIHVSGLIPSAVEINAVLKIKRN